MPHASIGSDIIVGFPGETDDDFEQLASLPRALAADAPPRVSRTPIDPARRRRAMTGKVHGAVDPRARPRGCATIGAAADARDSASRRSAPRTAR